MNAEKIEVVVEETGGNKFARIINANGHEILADEPLSFGGTNTGAAPYDLLLASLGACTSMTVRMYADHKGWALDRVHVRLSHSKDKATKQDKIEKILSFEGDLTEEQRARLMEIAERCPVNRTLKSDILIIAEEEALHEEGVSKL